MTGLSTIVTQNEKENGGNDDLFDGIDIELPDDVNEVINSSGLTNIVTSEDEGDTPSAELLESLGGIAPAPKYVGDTIDFHSPINPNSNSFEEYVKDVLQHGADKGVVNVVIGHCQSGMSKDHGKLIISGAMRFGFGKQEALELCTASLNGADSDQISEMISQYQPSARSNSKLNLASGSLIKSVFDGFTSLFNKQKSNFDFNEINSKGFDRAIDKVKLSAYEICKTSHAHNIAAARESISSPEELKKMIGNLNIDDQSKAYIDDYRAKVEILKKEAKSLLGKAKTKEQAEKVHSKIESAIEDLNNEYKDKLEFITDSARSPIAEFLDELGKEVDKMFKKIMERFGIRAKKSEDADQEESKSPSPSAG